MSINPIHTPCKSCVFAEYDNNTQNDCHLNLIEKYKSKNIEVLEVYDNDKEFYVINGRKCFGYRENSWFDKRNLSNLSLEDKIAHFKKNHFIHYLLLVDLQKFDTDQGLDNLKDQLASLSIKPRKIIMIRHQNDNKKYGFETLKHILEESNLGCKWRIQTALDNKPFLDHIHECSNLNKKYRFVCCMSEPCRNLNHVIVKANDMIYNELNIFTVLANQDRSITLFSAPNYRYSLFAENKNILTEPESFITV